MKLIVLCILAAAVVLMTGCADNAGGGAAHDDDRLTVVATIFPQFDFVRQIVGDRVNLSQLLSPGMESHGFDPSPRDIISIYEADLLIYVGGHGDEWVARIVASLDMPDLRTVALIDMVDPVHQVLVEGMEKAHDHHHGHDDHDDHHHDHHHDHDDDHHHDHHGHDHDHHDHDDHHHHHDHDHHHHDEYDEHVWTSPQNAILIVGAITNILSEMDPANAYYFRQNADAYISELQALDLAFAQMVAAATRRTVVFGDRFPFRYLMDAYGITYYAAFTGCSAETQASPATIAFLIDKVRDENLPVVFHIEFSTLLIANVIAEATGAELVELHSLHNVSPADFAAGVTFLDLMHRNVENLRLGLH